MAEETEMHAAVGPCLVEARVLLERMCLSVFEDEQTVLFEVGKDEVRQFGQSFQLVGGVGVDEIIEQAVAVQKLEYVSAHNMQIVDSQLLACLYDEVLLCVRRFHGSYFPCAPAHELQPDTACACKEVKHVAALEVHAVVEQVEKALFRKVSSRPCGDIFRGRQSTSPVFP